MPTPCPPVRVSVLGGLTIQRTSTHLVSSLSHSTNIVPGDDNVAVNKKGPEEA